MKSKLSKCLVNHYAWFLNGLVDRLSSKLKEYQVQLHIPESEFQNLFIGSGDSQNIADFAAMLSSHLLGPLFMEYESSLKQVERDLKNKKLEVQRQGEEMNLLIKENEELSNRLEVQQREYLKLVEETRDNADLLAMRTGSLKQGNESGVDEVKELRERVHLLTEENQVLFEQITLLRSHYDKYNEECGQKMQDADYKT